MFLFQSINAQLIESVYFGVDYRLKREIMHELKNFKYMEDKDFLSTGNFAESASFPIYIGLRFNDRFSFEIGYHREAYNAGYSSNPPYGLISGSLAGVDDIKQFFIRFNYNIFMYKRFSLAPQLALVYGNSTFFYAPPISLGHWFNGPGEDGHYMITYHNDEWKKDYGLTEHYFFLRPSIKIDYMVYSGLHLKMSGGYNQGFSSVGHYRGYFQIDNEPKEYIDNESFGSHYFIAGGFYFNFQLKEKPKIEKSEFVKIIEFDKDLNYDFGINLSTDIFSDGFNRYVLPSYGPIFKINYGLLGFSTSILFAKRNLHLHKDNVVSFYDYNNGTTSIYDIFLKYKTIESISFIRYSIYKGRKWKISPGLGFFITYPTEKGTYYTLQHSDGKSTREGFFWFSIPHFHFWGLTPNIEVEYLLSSRMKIGFDTGVKTVPFYQSFMENALYNVDRKLIFPVNFGLNVCYYIKK